MTQFMTAAPPEAVRVMPDGRKVTAIPARMQACAAVPLQPVRKPRVAAYARVSTDQEEQETSFEAQCDYYGSLIRNNPEWEYAGLYTDDGISATSTARREGFNRLIADALAGKIDRIITKSVSRFARNTVDSLTTIRKLKEKGIGVTFEKENIDTLDSKGELMITIMSSLAQEESRSISENVTWGWRRRIADGKVSMAYSRFLGYDRGEDGTPVVNEKEAETVRQIYGLFLDGQTPSGIAELLTKQRIPTPGGKERWAGSTVKSILTNEKYKGDALLQKTFTVDFLTKTAKVNEGEAPQFFVENSHPGIISREVFDLVQLEMKRRKGRSRHTSAKSLFSDRLVCSCCGGTFGSKVWHSNDPYRKVIWRCNRKYARKGNACPNRHLEEKELREAFVEAVNRLISRREEILSAADEFSAALAETSGLEQQLDRLTAGKDVILRKLTVMVHENAVKEQDQEEYQRQYQEVEGELSRLDTDMEKLKTKKADRLLRRNKLQAFMGRLRASEQPAAFDEGMFLGLTETVRVYPDKLVFVFRDGTEISV